MALERNSPASLTTVCGSSSLFVQVTVEPDLMVSDVGANMKSFAMTIVGDTAASPAREGTAGADKMSAMRLAARSNRVRCIGVFPLSDLGWLSGERRVAEGE